MKFDFTINLKVWHVLLIIFIMFLCVLGCSDISTPIIQYETKIPKSSTLMMQPCESMSMLKHKDNTIHDLSTNIIDNAHKYHRCENKVKAWQMWYLENRGIYETH